jgi:hypothetical protein
MRTSRSAGLTSLTAMMRRSGVVAVWRVKPARVLYGHFYFSKCEALLRTRVAAAVLSALAFSVA